MAAPAREHEPGLLFFMVAIICNVVAGLWLPLVKDQAGHAEQGVPTEAKLD